MTFLIGTPHVHNAGYFRNDDTCSGGKLSEADIQTCTHCQAVIKMQQWRIEGAWCSKCSAPICAHCGARALVFGCEPFIKKLEQHLAQVGKLQQIIKDSEPRPAASQPLIVTG